MEEKINNIWDRFNNELFLFINSKIGNRDDAEDLLQEVYIRIYKHIDSLKNEEKIKSWIYAITRNVITDYHKKHQNKTIDIDEIVLVNPEEDTNENLNHEVSNCLDKIVSLLPYNDKEILDLHHTKGMKHKEISRHLDISLSSSKMRFKRAKDKLKALLLQCCDFQVDIYGNIIEYNRKSNGTH